MENLETMQYFLNLYSKARTENIENVTALVTESDVTGGDTVRVAVLGCNNGAQSLVLTQGIRSKELWGVDIDPDAVRDAANKGVLVIRADLERPLPFRSESFDIVISNQVIEHLEDVDTFISEVHRICKKNGIAVISTENLASVDNIFALALGYQAFSQHISRNVSLGNPLSPQYRKPVKTYWKHKTIFTSRGLAELLTHYGFNVETVRGSGYGFLARIDPIHARFIAVRARKQ